MAANKKTSVKGTLLPMILIMATLLIISGLFLYVLNHLNVLPGRYFAAVIVLMVVVLLVIFLLMNRFRPSVRCMIGILLIVLYVGGLTYGGFVMKRTADTLDTISTETTIEVSEMVVYVRTEDKATDLNDVAAYPFGIMLDQAGGIPDVTNKALDQLEKELNVTLDLTGYEGGPASLVKALLNGDVDAILFNSVYLDMVSSGENFANVKSQVRALTSLRVETKVDTTKPSTDKKDNTPESAYSNTDHVITVLLSGNDTYGTLETNGRSDVNIVAIINTETKQVALISTPRDYYIEFPNSWGAKDKLTHASCYGIAESMGALEMLYDVNIDYYFRVNFSGFEDIINAIDGITINNDVSFYADADAIDQSIAKYDGYFYYPEGELLLDGTQALAYVRCRNAFKDGDFTRGRHQLMVIKAILKKMMSKEMLSNFSGLLSAIEGSFETSIPYSVMTDLVKMQLDDMAEWNIVQYAAAGWSDWQYSWGAGEDLSVVQPDYSSVDAAKEVIRQVFDDEAIRLPD